MPELPEVEIACRKLRPLLGGKRFLRFWTDWPRGLRISSAPEVKKDIPGKRIEKVERLGKAIVLHLSHERVLALHQKMSGKVLIVPQGTKDTHIHFRFALSGDKELVLHDVRKFGVVWYGREDEVKKESYFASLGKDALGVSFGEFKKLMESKKGMLKSLLLRQDVFSGVGNIIADETLWRARLHPKRRAEYLNAAEIKILWRSLRFVLNRSIKLGGSTMRDWLHPDAARGGYFTARAVYRRKGERCPRCAGVITRIVVASRGTFICASCQPDPN